MKRGILSLLDINPPAARSTHSTGWCEKWLELLSADHLKSYTYEMLSDYDELYVWNTLYGTPDYLDLSNIRPREKSGKKVENRSSIVASIVNDFPISLFQLDYNQHYYSQFTGKGLEASPILDNISVVKQLDIEPRRVVIGDAHSISVAPAGWSVNRQSGLTLYGALRRRLTSFLTGNEQQVIFKLGDIDARFHLARQSDIITAVEELVDEYSKQIKEVKDLVDDVRVVAMMPQTPDSRFIPSTVTYQGSTYYGTLQERQGIVAMFNEILSKSIGNVIEYPDIYFDKDGCLDTYLMEERKSVHLAPYAYLREKIEGYK